MEIIGGKFRQECGGIFFVEIARVNTLACTHRFCKRILPRKLAINLIEKNDCADCLGVAPILEMK